MKSNHTLVMLHEKKRESIDKSVSESLAIEAKCTQDLTLQFFHHYTLSFESVIYVEYNTGEFDIFDTSEINQERIEAVIKTEAPNAWLDFVFLVCVGGISGLACDSLSDIEWTVEKQIDGVSPGGVPEIALTVNAVAGTVSFRLGRQGYTGLPIDSITFNATAVAVLYGQTIGTLTFRN